MKKPLCCEVIYNYILYIIKSLHGIPNLVICTMYNVHVWKNQLDFYFLVLGTRSQVPLLKVLERGGGWSRARIHPPHLVRMSSRVLLFSKKGLLKQKRGKSSIECSFKVAFIGRAFKNVFSLILL